MASSEPEPEPAWMNNTLRMYYRLDEEMWLAHREKTDEGRAKANETARILLENADLPLLLRARACMILGCSTEEDYLEWAEEGVRIGEIIIAKAAGEVETTLLRNCKEVLEGARQAKAEEDEAEEDTEEPELAESAEIDEAEQTSGDAEEHESMEVDEGASRRAVEEGTTKSRRLHTDSEKIIAAAGGSVSTLPPAKDASSHKNASSRKEGGPE